VCGFDAEDLEDVHVVDSLTLTRQAAVCRPFRHSSGN